MTDRTEAPVTWALLCHQLDDAAEALASLRREMRASEFGEPEFRVHMAHVYGHLNRAWHLQNVTDAEGSGESQAQFERLTRFPDDLTPGAH